MKRALVSYLKYPTRLPQEYAIQFSNPGIVIGIVEALREMAYEVDVIDYTDLAFCPDTHYDLFVCPRGVNWEYLSRNVLGDAVKVFFACTLYWKEHNSAERERFADLERRRGVRFPFDRLLSTDEFALHDADGIICLGNEDAVKTFSGFPLCLPINNGVYPDASVDLGTKDFEGGRRHFLFYGSAGSVHKGLDRLLEAFFGLDADLYWVGQMEEPLRKLYESEIQSHPNIHLVGWVTLRSKSFYEVMKQCNCVILPSCAEGQVGGVVECMNQGLIPIVSRASVLDVKDFGLVMETCSVEEIRETVSTVAGQSASWHRERAEKARAEAGKSHSPEMFRRTLRSHLDRILAEATRRRSNRQKEIQATAENPSTSFQSHYESFGHVLGAGMWLMQQGRTADARLFLKRALELESECVTALSSMADLELSEGNRVGAVDFLLKAGAISPNDRAIQGKLEPLLGYVPDGRLKDPRVVKSERLMMSRAYGDVVTELSDMIESGCSDVECLTLFGEAQYSRGEREAGIAATKRASVLPNGERALRNLGWMLIQQGAYAEALAVYGQLGVPNPYDNEILVNKTYILQKLQMLCTDN